jgi:hypothetical protein
MFFWRGVFLLGVDGACNFAFVSFMLQEKWGGNMLGICHGRKRPNAI